VLSLPDPAIAWLGDALLPAGAAWPVAPVVIAGAWLAVVSLAPRETSARGRPELLTVS
jgi:hypothetical protein